MRILAAALLVAALPASAIEVAGVKVPDSFAVDGKTLVLNGAGLRTKTFLKVKVYVAGLYLPERTTDAAAVVALDAPKAMRLTLMRDVDRASFVSSLRDGIQSNSPDQAAGLEARLKQLEAAMPAEAKEGQVITLVFVPGTGTTVTVGDGKPVTIPGKDFSDALFRVWLGPKPTDGGIADLKESLLAGK